MGAVLANFACETGTIQATEEGAVVAAERHRPDLMIVDLKLVVGIGVAAVERITRAETLPHMLMSGLGPLRPGLATCCLPSRFARRTSFGQLSARSTEPGSP